MSYTVASCFISLKKYNHFLNLCETRAQETLAKWSEQNFLFSGQACFFSRGTSFEYEICFEPLNFNRRGGSVAKKTRKASLICFQFLEVAFVNDAPSR